MNWVLIVGLIINAIALPIAARRVMWLIGLIRSGQPDPGRVEGVTGRLGRAIKNQLVEVFGQQRLLKWTVPGAAHFFVFWAFVIGPIGAILSVPLSLLVRALFFEHDRDAVAIRRLSGEGEESLRASL